MDQISLSNDLQTISGEINSFKQVAGQSIIEIGKRLKHVKDNDLANGKFKEWARDNCDFDPQTAYKFIQAFEQFTPVATSRLPVSKLFEMLSLPESVNRDDFITTEHIVPSTGATKTVDEMTVKELREVKKALQESERAAAQAQAEVETERSSANYFKKLWEQAKKQPVRVETKTVEVIPADYAALKNEAVKAQQLNTEVVQLKRANETMRQQYEEKLSTQQKQDHTKKELQKLLTDHLRSLTMNHDSAIFNFTAIQGDREAYDIVMRFLHQYENIIKQQFDEWQQLTSIRAVK